MELKDKIIVITGAASGIDKAMAIRFAAEGAKKVVCVDLNKEGAQAVADEIDGVLGEDVGAVGSIGRAPSLSEPVLQSFPKRGPRGLLQMQEEVSRLGRVHSGAP